MPMDAFLVLGAALVKSASKIWLGDEAFAAELERVLETKQADISKILKDYGVPVLDRKAGAK